MNIFELAELALADVALEVREDLPDFVLDRILRPDDGTAVVRSSFALSSPYLELKMSYS